MKKFLLFITAIFICGVSIAQTIRWHIGDTVYQTTTCNAGESITPPIAPDKFGYMFQEWEVLYTPIEYLESTGTQYITLNVGENGQSKILEAEMEIVNFIQYSIFIGNTDKRTMTLNQIQINSNNVTWSGYFFSQQILTSVPLQKNIKYNVMYRYESGNSKYYVDDNLVMSSQAEGNVGNLFTLFANYSTNSHRYGNFSAIKIYKVVISDLNGKNLANLIPVLDKNGTPCMYDKVEGKFYYNAGTGQFIAGPMLNE